MTWLAESILTILAESPAEWIIADLATRLNCDAKAVSPAEPSPVPVISNGWCCAGPARTPR